LVVRRYQFDASPSGFPSEYSNGRVAHVHFDNSSVTGLGHLRPRKHPTRALDLTDEPDRSPPTTLNKKRMNNMTSQILINLTIYFCCGSILSFVTYAIVKWRALENLGAFLMYCAFLLLSAGFVLRCRNYYQFNHKTFQDTNLYDVVIVFSWIILLVISVLNFKFKYRALCAFLVPFSLCGILWAQHRLDNSFTAIPTLIDTYWVMLQTMTLSLWVAAFTIACGISMFELIGFEKTCGTDYLNTKCPSLQFLSNFRINALHVGVLALVLNIWANFKFNKYVGGSYLGRDTNELWAIFSLIVYVTILHLFKYKTWVRKHAACFSICSYILIIFAYFSIIILIPRHGCY
jgi:ABC-type transport system involved in cytochrome c biogenesis permease subunit